MIFNEPKSDAILCALKSYEDQTFVACIESDQVLFGANCIHDVFEACFEAANLVNDLDVKSKSSVLEIFKGEPFYARRVMLSSTWHLRRNVRVFWLGALAVDQTSSVNITLNETMTGAGIRAISLQIKRSEKSEHAVTPDPTASSSIIASMINPIIKVPLQRSNPKTIGCYQSKETKSCPPSIFLPGFDVETVASIYAVLVAHPMILPPLTSFAATGVSNCFVSETLFHRYDFCFPFIEPGEPFLSIDATASYYLDRETAQRIYQSNPSSKIIFIIDNPIERIYRSYVSMLIATDRQIPTLDDIVLRALRKDSIFGLMRVMFRNISNVDTMIETYYSIPDIKSNNTVNNIDYFVMVLFRQSIYFPAIVHYMHIFGEDQLLVLLADDIHDCSNLANFQSIKKKIYNFLELPNEPTSIIDIPVCRNRTILSTNYNQSNFNQSTIFPSISEEAVPALTSFFIPFHRALENITQLNLSQWMDPYYLAKRGHSFGSYRLQRNATFPIFWFDIEDNMNNHRSEHREGIISHLLPKGKAAADAGFNTTFGMLVAF